MNDQRADIQGLRGIAVLLVVLFHFLPKWVPGGYVGVDVFFVVSGFLITHLLLREARDKGRPFLLAFASRRILRLLPASTSVLVFVALCHSLFPLSSRETLAQHLRAAALFIINFQFIAESADYLATDSPPSILLHYWSLSVEEQFYVMWPLTLTIAWKLGRKRGVVFSAVLLCGASFVCSVTQTAWEPTVSYFAPWTRAWEFLLGALATLMGPHTLPFCRLTRALPRMGLGLIVVSAFALNETSPFPGALALLPCSGAVLVLIPAIQKAPEDSLLTSYPLRKLGDVSYSLYLWHYPLMRLAEGVDGSSHVVVMAQAGAFLSALGISLASKRFIEDPCRNLYRGKQMPQRHLLLAASSMLSVTFVIGVLSHDVIQARFDQELTEKSTLYKSARSDLARVYGLPCYQDYASVDPNPCVLGRRDGKRRIALVGDSHAVHWVPALETLAHDHDIRLDLYAKMGCGFADVSLVRSGNVPYVACSTWRQKVFAHLEKRPPDLLLLTQARHQTPSGGNPHEQLVLGIGKTLHSLRMVPSPILLLADTPRPTVNVPYCLLKTLDSKACSFSLLQGQRTPDAIAAYAKANKLAIVDLSPAICPKNHCPALINGIVVWRDEHHMTASYAKALTEPLRQQIEKNRWIF